MPQPRHPAPLEPLLLLALFFIPNAVSVVGKTWHRSMTFVVDAGMEDCYYLPNVTAGQNIDLEYQVRSNFKLRYK